MITFNRKRSVKQFKPCSVGLGTSNNALNCLETSFVWIRFNGQIIKIIYIQNKSTAAFFSLTSLEFRTLPSLYLELTTTIFITT